MDETKKEVAEEVAAPVEEVAAPEAEAVSVDEVATPETVEPAAE